MKVENVFTKIQDYNTTISSQGKLQRVESLLKEVFDKKILIPPTTHSSAKYTTYWLSYKLL